jgi:hypothetical protein
MNSCGVPFLALRRPEAIEMDGGTNARLERDTVLQLAGEVLRLREHITSLEVALEKAHRDNSALQRCWEKSFGAASPPTLVWDLPAAPGQPVLWRWLRS